MSRAYTVSSDRSSEGLQDGIAPGAELRLPARRNGRVLSGGSRVRLVKLLLSMQRRPQQLEELLKLSGVSRRTLFRDLAMLRDAGVRIRRSYQDRAYRVAPIAGYALSDLSPAEAAALLHFLERRPAVAENSVLDCHLRRVMPKLRRACEFLFEADLQRFASFWEKVSSSSRGGIG